jgi:hypothetical protein
MSGEKGAKRHDFSPGCGQSEDSKNRYAVTAQ